VALQWRYRGFQALQRPYLYGGPIVSILLTGSFVLFSG
jgi:hypothetical protein